MSEVVVKGCAYNIIHVPDFIRYGSKPERDIQSDPELLGKLTAHTRKFEDAVSYAPNQAFLGNLHPDKLHEIGNPWFKHPIPEASQTSKYGRMIPEDEFYAILKISDEFDLVWIDESFLPHLRETIEQNPLFDEIDSARLETGHSPENIQKKIDTEDSLPLFFNQKCIGCFHRHHEVDQALSAEVLMENLLTKATAGIAVRQLLKNTGLQPEDVGYIMSSSEEAIGDRYQRGGGNLAKAVGEMCRCVNATGSDVKAFCAGPVYAIVHAASLVKSGIFDNVVVFGGGCMAKLGMKYQGHLKHDMPILEDILGAEAFLITKDDGANPIIRTDSIGIHDIGSGAAQQAIMESLTVKPLRKIGLKLSDVDKFSTEMHNPEVTEPQGSGNVPLNNYRMIAALAVMNKEIEKKELMNFVKKHGMPGFSPTQGHIPAAVPFLGHAIDAMQAGTMQRAQFLAKGSLFLGRMSHLSDGMSFVLEKNPQAA